MRRLVVFVLLLAMGCASDASEQESQAGDSAQESLSGDSEQESYRFITVTRGDTIATENVVRTDSTVDVELLDRRQGGFRWEYSMKLAPGGLVGSVTAELSVLADPDQTGSGQHEFVGDSVRFTLYGGQESHTRMFETQDGALPYINPSAAMIEQALRRARSMGDGSSQTVPMFALVKAQTDPWIVSWLGSDSATVDLGAVAMRVAVAPDGSLLGLKAPSQGVEVTRLDGHGAGR